LRNYAGGEDIVWGGDPNCDHEWEGSEHHEHREEVKSGKTRTTDRFYGEPSRKSDGDHQRHYSNVFCVKCGCWLGQLGLEPDYRMYISHLVEISREIWRVLKKDGSYYLNLGYTYAGSGCGAHDYRDETSTGILRKRQRELYQKPNPQVKTGYDPIARPKQLLLIPEMVAIALQEEGWLLRNLITWYKPNHMPSSVKDRLTNTTERILFLVKQRKYYFDLDSIRVPHKTESLERYQRGVNLGRPAEGKSGQVGPMQEYIRAPKWFQEMFPPDEDYKGKFDLMFERGSNTGEHNKEPYRNNNPHRVRLEQARQADIFGHGPNPQSFNLRVRDVKRGKASM